MTTHDENSFVHIFFGYQDGPTGVTFERQAYVVLLDRYIIYVHIVIEGFKAGFFEVYLAGSFSTTTCQILPGNLCRDVRLGRVGLGLVTWLLGASGVFRCSSLTYQKISGLGGGFKYCLCSCQPGPMIHFD